MTQVCGSRQTSRIARLSLRGAASGCPSSQASAGGDDDQRDVDADEHPRVLRAGGRQHQQADELHGGDAEVAAAGVEAERPALEPLG